MNELNSFLTARGYAAALGLPLDGTVYRFTLQGKEGRGWFKGRIIQGKIRAWVGDWKTGEKLEFASVFTDLTPEQLAAYDAECKAASDEDARLEALRQEEVAAECQKIWSESVDRGQTPYMVQKQFRNLFDAKIYSQYTDTLLIPARDIDGKLWSIQRIFGNGEKRFASGGKKRGCFHLIGSIDPEKEVYVAEGFATAVAISEALSGSAPVVTAFDAGNLEPVGRALRGKFPALRIIFCADDDRYSEQQPVRNRGVEEAHRGASSVGGEVRLPTFKSYDTRPTDFDDLKRLEGLDVVKQQLLNPPVQAAGAETQPPEKPVFSEKRVAEALLSAYSGKLVRQDKNLFHYDGRKWDELDSVGLDHLKNHINALCGDKLDSKKVTSCYNTFFRYVPGVPEKINLFQPRSDVANFQNGTLHMEFRPKTPEELAGTEAGGTHVFSLRFAPHNPTDFCTTVLPLDYQPMESLPENEELQTMFRKVWPDADQEGKIRLYEEILGACLIPRFPQLFFFLGEPKTGKSTLIMLLSKLVGDQNSSNVDPTLWGQSFGMEDMVNKLVNFDTDISTTRKLPDDLAKKIIDGVFRVTRKHQTAVKVRLPAVHAFGANAMPKSGEGGSGAYDRRAIIIKTDTVQPGQGGGGTFADWVWGRGPNGVLKAALRGLTRLLAHGGIYSVPDSAHEEMAEWKLENDPVLQFVQAVERGEVWAGESGTPGNKLKITVGESASILSAAIYQAFVGYVTDNDGAGRNRSYILTHRQFSARLYRDRRFKSDRTNVARIVSGIGVCQEEGPG